MKKLMAYSAEKGYVMIRQWGPIDVLEFRQSWGVSPVTSGKEFPNLNDGAVAVRQLREPPIVTAHGCGCHKSIENPTKKS